MARTIRNRKLDSRSARRAIPIGKATHWVSLAPGRGIGYRKNNGSGAWVARLKTEAFRREEKLGDADDILDADGVQILSYEQAQEKARKWYLSATTEATGQHVIQPRGYTVEQCCLDYLRHLELRGAPDHRNAKYDLHAYAIPKLGALQVSKLARPKLEQWRTDIALSPRRTSRRHEEEIGPHTQTEEDLRKRRSTANRILRRLRAALNLALEEGRVYANPIAWKVMPFENVELARAVFLSEKEQRTFVKSCGDEMDFQLLVRAGLYAGARYGELGRLHVGDFNASAETVFIAKSKGGQQRYIHLDPEAARFFREECANRESGETMFSRDSGEPWAKDSQKKPMRRACALARTNGFGFHQLRHTAASRWITLGVSLKVVAEQLGHVDTTMVERYYGHLASGHIAQTFRALPGIGLDKAANTKRSRVIPIIKKGRA